MNDFLLCVTILLIILFPVIAFATSFGTALGVLVIWFAVRSLLKAAATP